MSASPSLERLSISVAIATYRRPASLRRTVRSLLEQRRRPEQIIVSCWGGDAATVRLLERLGEDAAAHDIPVLPCVGDVDSLAARMNAAIVAADGDVVAFIDDDAVARPDWLERLAAPYRDADVGAVGGRDVVWLDGVADQRTATRIGTVAWWGRLHGNHHRVSRGARSVDFLKGCNMSYRREQLTQLDPHLRGTVPYGFEIDLGLAVRSRGLRVVYDAEAVVDHYPSSYMGADSQALARVVNHNQTYILLKHLPATRRAAFLLYTTLIGDRGTLGVLRLPQLRRSPHPWAILRAHLAGKWAGLSTSVAARRRSRPSADAIATSQVTP